MVTYARSKCSDKIWSFGSLISTPRSEECSILRRNSRILPYRKRSIGTIWQLETFSNIVSRIKIQSGRLERSLIAIMLTLLRNFLIRIDQQTYLCGLKWCINEWYYDSYCSHNQISRSHIFHCFISLMHCK